MLRSLRRNVIKNAMKGKGFTKICKRHGYRGHGRSYFAEHWGSYVK